MASWPVPRRISPLYDEVAPASARWLRSFNAFGPKAQKVFDDIKPGLLVALTFPNVDKEHLRAACDLMNLVFVADEYTDCLSESEARRLADISMDALRSPFKAPPAGESIFGEITRQFSILAIQRGTETSRARFEDTWDRFLNSVVEQARDREEGRLRTVEEHMAVRRLTIAVEPFLALSALALDLPAEDWDNPIAQSLHADITDLVFLDNDLTSYKKEKEADDVEHNIITVAMRQYGLDLDGGVRWLADQHKARVDNAIATWKQACEPSSDGLPKMSDKLAEYVDHIMNWPRGNDCWNFESGRYFGSDGLHVQEERVVELLPTVQRVTAEAIRV